MTNKFSFILLVLISVFYNACSPDNLVPPTIIDPGDNNEENTNNPPQAIIVKKSITNNFTNFKIDFNSAVNYYLGSVWSLGDTSQSFKITHLPSKEKKDKIHFLSNNFSVDMESHVPSYENMLSYAKKFKPGPSNLSFSSDTFFDYGIIQYYLGNSDDYKIVKDLVAVNDSTYIRKKNGISRYSLQEFLFIYTDIVEINEIYDQNYLKEFKEENVNPYYISSVTYGAESIFLAESDSTRIAFNKAFDKLTENLELNDSDIAVLDASNLLIYRRDSGSRASYIKYAKGSSAIRRIIREFTDIAIKTANAVDYPFSFTMSRLDDMSTLKYDMKYDVFVKAEK